LLIKPISILRKGYENKYCCYFSDLSFRPANAYLEPMKDLNALMQQAQAMQQKLQDAQAKMAETTASGTSGGGLVTIALKGAGEITSIVTTSTTVCWFRARARSWPIWSWPPTPTPSAGWTRSTAR
jgi:hypothetical protein